LKHLSGAYIAALTVFVAVFIIIDQFQYITHISTIKSSQSFLKNCEILLENIPRISSANAIIAAAFIVPLLLIKIKFKGYFAFVLYILLGALAVYLNEIGMLPYSFSAIETVGSAFIETQLVDNITTVSSVIPSQTFLVNTLNYAFVVALVLSSETCACTNVTESITGDKNIQASAELASVGFANFFSIVCGGLFISPNIPMTIKNISYKAKTIIGLLIITLMSFYFVKYATIIMNYIPVYCLSAILIEFAVANILNKKPLQYFRLRNYEDCIFIITMTLIVFFGIIPAVIIGFIISMFFFAKRMIKIKDVTVYTAKNHDAIASEFILNKRGFSRSLGVSAKTLNKIEVIQVPNILFLNVAKLVEEGFNTKGSFPKALILYFKNVSFLDNEAISSLKYIVEKVKSQGCIVVISGTNGMLVDILHKKERELNIGQAFGYVVPDLYEAIKKTAEKL
jgi:SulP family sulfate permease